MTSNKSHTSRSLVAILITALLALVLAEWYLGIKRSTKKDAQPNYRRLLEAHAPYAKKRPHSEYGFFLPNHGSALDDTSNLVHVSPGGFRGPGPEAAEGRRLAFLVGNSVVFGFAGHDSLTISGHLNRIQTKFFFVNAGVPSWVSSQMRRRLSRDLLAYEPALIVFWGGHNDASLAYSAATAGRAFDPNRIESPSRGDSNMRRLLRAVVPNLVSGFERMLPAVNEPVATVSYATSIAAAEAFASNVEAAYRATSRSGARFLAVYQPILDHHENRPAGSVPDSRRKFFENFHHRTVAQVLSDGIPLLDLGSLFEDRYETVPVFTAGTGSDLEDQVFVDRVHLYVPGNKVVAQVIAAQIANEFTSSQKNRF